MGRKVDFTADDWLPEEEETEEGSWSDDYDWSHSMDFEPDLDPEFTRFER